MSDFYSEAAFLDAWLRGVELAGPRFFGGEMTGFEPPVGKWDFAPRYDDIVDNLGVMSRGETVFLVSMYSFFNSTVAGQLLADMKIGATSPGGLSALMDEKRRRVLADLLVSYTGW